MTGMKILTYDEVDKKQIPIMGLNCFGSVLNPDAIDKTRRLDPRMSDFLSLYAVEDRRILGQVGVHIIDTLTKRGKEKVGGIWGVCTHPSVAKMVKIAVNSFLVKVKKQSSWLIGLFLHCLWQCQVSFRYVTGISRISSLLDRNFRRPDQRKLHRLSQ